MKLYLLIFLMIFGFYQANSQSLSLYNLDTYSYPSIRANFYAFDADGNQITNLSPSDFVIQENGQLRPITSVWCPSPKPPELLSSVLVIDVSGSMAFMGLDIAKAAANSWIDILPTNQFQCAITSFSDINYLNQDFTNNKMLLKNSINNLNWIEGTNYNAAMIDSLAGGILIAKSGIYKRIIVFLSDGMPNFEPNTDNIISMANTYNITIYCVSLDIYAPQCMKDMAVKTGGLFFEKINTKEKAVDCYKFIQMASKNIEPCSIEWQSEISCLPEKKNAEVRLISNNMTANLSYQTYYGSEALLEFNPSSVKFENAEPGIKKDTIIKVTAMNADFNITNIIASNPSFEITPVNFNLLKGQSRNLTISFFPPDSGYLYCEFDFDNDRCPSKYSVSGGFSGKRPKIKTLKLIHPNGGQKLVVGKDTVITWKGVLPEELVKIEYSTDNGENWLPISDTASGLSYKWRIPKTPSNQCLARVTAKMPETQFICENGEVRIGKQIWMCKNLNVAKYRNGDSITRVRDDNKQWASLTTGAYCSYNSANKDYGLLYNWYAVNDPRGLAPVGWHIPSDEEWTELENYLGGSSVAGGKLKETGNASWKSPNIGATNESGFTALPSGYRNSKSGYYEYGSSGTYCVWWTSSEESAAKAWMRDLYNSFMYLGRDKFNKEAGFSVRCIKD